MKMPYIILVALLAFISGYFTGREHIKSEIESTASNAGKALATGFKEAFSGDSPAPSIETPHKKPEIVEKNFEVGETFSSSTFNFLLEKVSIDFITTETLMSSKKLDEKFLIMAFRVDNIDERRVLSYFEKYDSFRLVDDVGNEIDSRHTSFSERIEGTVKYQKIDPGQTLRFIQIFELPLPKTKSLSFFVKLKCLGIEDKLIINIPIEKVEGFSTVE